MARTVAEYLQMLCPAMYDGGFADIFIELATDDTSLSFFGAKYYNYAIALRAAHNYTLITKRSNGDAGLITAKQEGRLQKSFLHNMTRNSKSDLLMTIYGQLLQSLIRSLGPIASVGTTAIDLNASVPAQVAEDFI